MACYVPIFMFLISKGNGTRCLLVSGGILFFKSLKSEATVWSQKNSVDSGTES